MIDDYCNKIIVALQSSTVWGYKDNGSHVQNNNVKQSLDLSKLKHEARQIHKIWSNNGKIKYGMLHKSMAECRKRYELEIKRSKERQRQRRIAIMLKACQITMMLNSGSNRKKLRKSHIL